MLLILANKIKLFNKIKFVRNYNTWREYSIKITFIGEKTMIEKTVIAEEGINMLELAHKNDIELEGACEGGLACSTCHLIVENQKYFDKLPEATEEEEDMLDLAFGLTETSRLGCQINAIEKIDGIKFIVPDITRNFKVI